MESRSDLEVVAIHGRGEFFDETFAASAAVRSAEYENHEENAAVHPHLGAMAL